MSGTFHVYDPFVSNHVARRRVDVWLPPGYAVSRSRHYPVVYVQDGQNLFDAATAYIGVAWEIDRATERLLAEGVVRAPIIVGIWNTESRIPEYMPQKPLLLPHNERILRRFADRYGGEPVSDAYLRFIIDELKPTIDRTYRTLPGRDSTSLLGSSMGGLVSLYGLCEHRAVFGSAVCMSTAWTVGGKPVLEYLRSSIPDPETHRVYFDHGNEAQIGAYEKLQHAVDMLFGASGYQRDVNYMSLRFDGSDHSEAAWKQRVEVPLRFVLGRHSRPTASGDYQGETSAALREVL